MRNYYSLILLAFSFFILPQFYTQGVDFELLQHYTFDDIEEVFMEYGVPSILISSDYEVDYYRVTYPSVHPNGDSIIVSGGMCVPSNVQCPIPIVSYQHGTISEQLDVPSTMSYEGSIGVILSSNGYLSLMPDYVGLGVSEYFHPYVHSESEAQSCVDMLFAAYELQSELSYNLDDQLFLFGYSQGGHATAAMQKKIEEEYSEQFSIKASAPMSGPYDISGVQTDFLLEATTYPSPGYLPYVILSYQEVYGNIFSSLDEVFLPEYLEYIQEFWDETISLGTLDDVLPIAPIEMIQESFLEDFTSNENNPLYLAMLENDLYDWAPESLTKLFYCSGDDAVSYLNSEVALEYFENNGSTNVSSVDGGAYDHGACAPFAMLASYSFFEENRESAFEPNAELSIQNVSSIDAEDGSIELIIADTTGLEFSWSNGEQGLINENLAFGYYAVSISNEFGCEFEISGIVGINVGVTEQDKNELKVYPNPAKTYLIIDSASETFEINIYNGTGAIVISKVINQGINQIDLKEFDAGMYYIKSQENNKVSMTFMKS